MEIPNRWRLHRTGIGRALFAVLSIPVLIFAILVGLSDGFTLARILAVIMFLLIVGFTCWLLWYGLQKGSIVLVTVAMIAVIVILVAYAAAISVLVGGLKIDVF